MDNTAAVVLGILQEKSITIKVTVQPNIYCEWFVKKLIQLVAKRIASLATIKHQPVHE